MDGFRLDEVRGLEVVRACSMNHLALFKEVGGVNAVLFEEGLELACGHLVESIVRSFICCRHLLFSLGWKTSFSLEFFVGSFLLVLFPQEGRLVAFVRDTRTTTSLHHVTNKKKKKRKTKKKKKKIKTFSLFSLFFSFFVSGSLFILLV